MEVKKRAEVFDEDDVRRKMRDIYMLLHVQAKIAGTTTRTFEA